MSATPTLRSSAPWIVPAASSLVRDGRITAPAKVLYLILQSYASPDSPIPFPSLETLAKHLGSHRKTIQRHLKELETWNLIDRSFVKDAGRWHATRYTLKPHTPKGKTGHRRHILSPGQKRPSSITHMRLVKKTPDQQAPEQLRIAKESGYHPAACNCVECRTIREAAGF